MALNLKGIIPATVTPFNKKGEIDFDDLKEYMKWVSKAGIVGVAINVDTGEGPHLYPEERKAIIEAVAEVLKGKVAIVAGLIARFNDEAYRLAIDCKESGADALLVFPIPAYAGRPLPPEIPYEFHKDVGKAGLPLILFQLQPGLGGVEYDPQTLVKLTRLKCVIAIKEASFDAKKYIETVRVLRKAPRKITILTGNDDFILESLILGSEGALIGFGTLAAQQLVEMYEKVVKMDYKDAWEIWEKLLPLEETVFAPPVRDYRARIKEALRILGVIKTSYVRPPLRPVTKAESQRIRRALKMAELLP